MTKKVNCFVWKNWSTAIKKGSKDTCPGVDNITYTMISHLPSKFKEQLLKIYNKVWTSDAWIDQWRNTIILPFLKPNKDPSLVTSIRPIALTSCVLKTLERLIKLRLEHFLESRSIIPTYQYGFRKGKSATDCLVSLICEIEKALKQKQVLTVFSMDLTSAYDNVNITILLRKLRQLELPEIFVYQIIKMLEFRVIMLHFEWNNQLSLYTYQGLPQGVILSPILFTGGP